MFKFANFARKKRLLPRLRTAEHVNVQVRHLLTAVAAGIDHRPEAAFAAHLLCQNGNKVDHFTQKCGIFGTGFGKRNDVFFRNDQKVNRSLRIDVVEGDHVVVFVDERRGDFTVSDLAEDAAHFLTSYFNGSKRRRFSSSPLKPSRRSSSASTCSGRRPYCESINPANPNTHYKTTGPEIWKETERKIDILVAGIGTGGTISGIGKYLKEKNPEIQIVGVEPASSPLLTEHKAGPHGIQGIGANFVPNTLNTKIYDEILTVKDEDAYKTGRMMAHKEGMLVGISSGASVYAAMQLAKREENKGKMIVAILPDTGERYLSTPMFE